MAKDLKPMLSKVLASGGDKKFYFAYGAGKRKDGKGDGELAVGGQKPKKTEIEGELAACNEVHEGVCWVGNGPDSNGTVYFQGKGKKLSPMVVAKMVLTAKRTTGLQYDFQVPSPEEEARAAKLAEGEGAAAPAKVGGPADQDSGAQELSGTPESMTYQRVLADLMPRYDQARVINAELVRQMEKIEALAKANRYADALEMLDQLEIDVDRTLASAPKPAAPGDEFKARLKALLPKYNAAIKEDAALLARLRPLMGQVIAQGNANQFEQALPLLIQIEKALRVARPGDKADAASPASGMQRLNGLMPAIKAALSASGPNVARIQTLVSAAGGLLKNKDTVQADRVLDELKSLLNPSAGAGATDPATAWKVKLAECSPAIKVAMTAKGPNAADIAKLLAQATALSKPGGDMAQALAKLTECHALANSGASTNGDPAAEWKAKLAEWSPAIKAAMVAKGPNAADIAKLLAQATALSKPGGDMAQALAKLTECHALATSGGATTGADPAAEWKAKLAEWSPAIKAALAAKGPNTTDIAKLLAQATAQSKPGGDMAQALAKLTECHALATSGTGDTTSAPTDQAPSTEQAPTDGQAQPETDLQAAVARWNAARAAAVAKLRDEIKEVVATKDPDAVEAELELKAVMKQLAGKMETRQQATEMDRYLRQDDVVADVCELAFDLKTPLLKVLDEITPLLPA